MDRKKDGVLKLRCVHICKFLNQPISIPVSSADETLCSPIFYNVCLSPYIFTVAFFIRIISRLEDLIIYVILYHLISAEFRTNEALC